MPALSAVSGAHTDFRPPRLHPPTLRLWNAGLPVLLRFFCDVVSVEIPADDLERLRALADERLLIAPNHPTNDDPALLYALAREAGMPFYYLACRETFDGLFGLWGWIIQRLGAYSVVRGAVDRESFRTTRRLLCEPAGKVVIFPEGEVYSQNDTLLPFHAGVVQLAFWALEDLRKTGKAEKAVSLLPVAVRYCFVEDMTRPIEEALERLEAVVGLPVATIMETTPYARLRRIGVTVLETMEVEYGLSKTRSADMAGEEDLTPRMEALKALLLNRAAALMGIALSPAATLPERMRTLMNSVYAVTQEPPQGTPSEYQERLHRQQAARAAPLLRDLNRVANWIAVEDNYVRAKPTPDRMADNIRRLEVEVFGKARLHGRRRAVLRVGEPISPADFYEQYREDRRAAVSLVTEKLENAVQRLLDQDGGPVESVSEMGNRDT